MPKKAPPEDEAARAMNGSQLIMVAILSAALSAGATYLHFVGRPSGELAGYIAGERLFNKVAGFSDLEDDKAGSGCSYSCICGKILWVRGVGRGREDAWGGHARDEGRGWVGGRDRARIEGVPTGSRKKQTVHGCLRLL